MWVRLSRFQRTGRNFWSRNIVMRLGFLTTILWDNIQRMKQRGKPCITWWLCKNSRIQMSQTQTKAMGPHYFRPSIFKKLLFRIQRGESFLFWSIYPMPLCSQPFFLKRFSRAPFFFWGGITHAQTVWVLRKPSGFQETSLCLSSGLLLDPPSGLCDVRLWPSREVQWSRNRAAEEHDATQIDDLSSSPKKAWKQTNHWLVCGKNTKKPWFYPFSLCKKGGLYHYIFQNQHGTSNMELPIATWFEPFLFSSNPHENPWWVHTSWISTLLATKKILGHASERSRNPLWVAIQIHTFQMPISHSCLGLKNNCSLQFFFVWDVFCRFRFLFFFGKWSTRQFSWKAAKKVSGLVKLCFLGRVFAYHLRSYPILAANKPENMRLDGSGQHLGGKTDGFLRNQGQQGAVGFRKMWGVDGFTRCEGYKMLGKSWWCFSNIFFLDGEKLVLNFKLTPRFLLTTGVKTL